MHPDHNYGDGDIIQTNWSYDPDRHMIDLEIITQYEENTSCNCHPEYETRTYHSYHDIPADDLAPTMDAEIDDEWTFDILSSPWLASLAVEIKARKEAEAEKLRQEAARRAEAYRRATEQRERDELACLQAKYKG